MKESTIEKTAIKLAKEKGYLTYKFVSPNNKGVPDRIFIKNGRVIFVEFKAPNKKATALQQYVINEMLLQQCEAYVIDNIEKINEVL